MSARMYDLPQIPSRHVPLGHRVFLGTIHNALQIMLGAMSNAQRRQFLTDLNSWTNEVREGIPEASGTAA